MFSLSKCLWADTLILATGLTPIFFCQMHIHHQDSHICSRRLTNQFCMGTANYACIDITYTLPIAEKICNKCKSTWHCICTAITIAVNILLCMIGSLAFWSPNLVIYKWQHNTHKILRILGQALFLKNFSYEYNPCKFYACTISVMNNAVHSENNMMNIKVLYSNRGRNT